MRDVLKKVHFMIERHMIKENLMLVNLPHVADMRHNRQLELLCHQTDCQELVHACESCAICLNKMDSTVKEVVLEHNSVGDVLTGSNTNRSADPRDFCVGV